MAPSDEGAVELARLGERKCRIMTELRFLSLSQPLVPRVCQLPRQREPRLEIRYGEKTTGMLIFELAVLLPDETRLLH